MPRLSLRARRFFFPLKIAKRSFHRRKDQSFFFLCKRETELTMNIFMVAYHGNEVNVKISLIFNDW